MRSHAKASSAGSTQRQVSDLGRFVPGALVALIASLALATPASATKTHLFKEAFGSAAQPTFTNARGVAVVQSTGDVLVMDAGSPPSIKRYNADGTADNFPALGSNVIDGKVGADLTPQDGLGFGSASESQIAIDNSGGATDGNIYVTQSSPNAINIFSKEGNYLGQLTAAGVTNFSEACGVAVDSAGAVYVGDFGGGIKKFVPAANPPVNADHAATFTTTTNPCTLAAGVGPTAGFLFPARFGGAIAKIDSGTGELKYTVSSDSHTTVSVDAATGHVYAATNNSVKQFDASGAGSATSVASFSAPTSIQGVALSATGNVYVSRSGATQLDVYGPVVTLPTVATGSASSIGSTSATLNGTMNPDGEAVTECLFEYGKTTLYGQTVACAQSPATIGSGTSNVPVSANLSGLDLGAEYHFRLVGKNANGAVNGSDQAFKLQSPPVIKEAWSQEIAFKEGILKAKINPEGFATTYNFEWGTTPSYGSSTPVGNAGSDKADHTVEAAISGLTPGTTYHYRVVATNSIGTSETSDRTFTTYAPIAADPSCPNQALRGGAAANTGSCRAYEMVSPVEKAGGDISTGPNAGGYRSAYTQSSPDGEKITYSSITSFGDQASGHYSNQYIASRGENGWSTHGINAPQRITIFDPNFNPSIDLKTHFEAFTDDLSSAWIVDFNKTPLTPSGVPDYINFYRRDNTTDSFEALSVNPPIDSPSNTYGSGVLELAELQGISEDGSHSVFAARARLTPDAAANTSRQLYEFTNGALRLVSILPGESASPTGGAVGTYRGYDHPGAQRSAAYHNAVSDDGSRIFWSSGGSGGESPIYVRINGATTVPVSSGAAQWWTATPDGANALFSEGGLGGSAVLKTFDVEDESTTTIAGGSYGVLGASEDLSHIYFVSREVLDSGATLGQPNLYVDREGTKTFIATLDALDAVQGNSASSVVNRYPINHSSRVTPDGRHVAFQSMRSLTGYDNKDAITGKESMQVYVYDLDSEQLTCASCNPSGGRSIGRPLTIPFTFKEENVEQLKRSSAAWLPTEEVALHTSRPLSEDGNHLFFNSFDALVPQDSNRKLDVYEWQAPGSGSCQAASGCVSLISTGRSPKDSQFLDASEDGRDIFFETSSSIAPEDPGGVDIYDARAGGGFPQPPAAPDCEGDACQPIPPPVDDPTPASASFRGPGDRSTARTRRCAKPRKAGKSHAAKRRKAARRCRQANRRAKR